MAVFSKNRQITPGMKSPGKVCCVDASQYNQFRYKILINLFWQFDDVVIFIELEVRKKIL